jgi:hypothetical protein
MLKMDGDEWDTTGGRYSHVYTYPTEVLCSLHFTSLLSMSLHERALSCHTRAVVPSPAKLVPNRQRL